MLAPSAGGVLDCHTTTTSGRFLARSACTTNALWFCVHHHYDLTSLARPAGCSLVYLTLHHHQSSHYQQYGFLRLQALHEPVMSAWSCERRDSVRDTSIMTEIHTTTIITTPIVLFCLSASPYHQQHLSRHNERQTNNHAVSHAAAEKLAISRSPAKNLTVDKMHIIGSDPMQ